MRTKRVYKARLIYFFTCTNCGRVNSRTYTKHRLRLKVCRKCQRKLPDERQLALPIGATEMPNSVREGMNNLKRNNEIVSAIAAQEMKEVSNHA